jgi:hypothetical protein
MPYIAESQLRVLEDIADELRRFSQIEDQVGMPAAFYLKQLDKALPDLALRITALVIAIQGQDDMEARF